MAYQRKFKDTIECYDCHEKVWDLKAHRATCSKSHKAKSILPGSEKAHLSSISAVSSSSSSHGGSRAGMKKSFYDFYFLIDVSGSMEGSKLNTAKVCAKDMIAGNMNPLDRLAIVTFDTGAFFKLKPRAVEEILRKGELDPILARIFAQGGTALYDAIHLTVSQIRDKSQNTVIIVLTDGEDNSSKTTYQRVLTMIKEYPNISLHIVHIDGHSSPIAAYNELCLATKKGEYTQIVVEETIIKITIEKIVKRYYQLVE